MDPAGFTLTATGFATADGSYRSLTNPSAVEVIDNNAWKHMRCPLASITEADSSGSNLNVEPTCFANNSTAVISRGFPFNGSGLPSLSGVTYLENAYQLLDEPGEFYLDSAAGQLYYKPRPGEDLATADVELPVLERLLDASGTPGHLSPIDDTNAAVRYTGSAWEAYGPGRNLGDLYDTVHATKVNGDSVSYTFTGTGVDVMSETNSDEGAADIYIDGTWVQNINAWNTDRLSQQVIASVTDLPKGQHTVTLVKTGGEFLVVDGFTVLPDPIAPVHDVAFRGLHFAHTTWNGPSTTGYVDNQAGVLWDSAPEHNPVRIPAAVQVHRGSNITFTGVTVTHVGGAGIDLADGTQHSSVIGSFIDDASGGGISVGEVDDYYLTDTRRMTTGDTISQNWISRVGQDYSDAVGVWAGYTRDLTIDHNDIGHTPYSGVSVGWGWGWSSPCEDQASQGLPYCARGTIYAQGNRVLYNHIHDVMQVLHDGGPIYTNGGQGDGSVRSEVAGNVIEAGNHTNFMLYHDEGSSYWNTHDNVVRFNGQWWTGMWTPTIHDIVGYRNYSDLKDYDYNRGTNVTMDPAISPTDGVWPPAAKAIIAAVGPDATRSPLAGRMDDDDTAIDYTGAWNATGGRGKGEYLDNVHSASRDGDSASLTFAGTSVAVVGDKNSDQGLVEIFIDGESRGLVDTSRGTSEGRQVQVRIYSSDTLAPGTHTVQVVKRSGTRMVLDGFQVNAVVNDTSPAIDYGGQSWVHYTYRGFGDLADDVHATTANGDTATVTFTGTAITVLSETNRDQGTIAVNLDGVVQPSVNTYSAARHAQQPVYTATSLRPGRHTLTLTKTGGTWMLIDGYRIQ
ncbi:Right handed beta helix region [Streptomyces sp. TLI_053]|nr:Right handed beta helix region [Streptomyces sp. TLI_053]